jgi:hypothetical protein
MSRVLVPLLTAGLLVASGLAQGFLTDRWSPRAEEAIKEARARLEKIPTRVGDWDGVPRRWSEFDQAEKENDYITREYVNRVNHNAVGMLMAAGRSYNVWQWHTPDQCYPAKGYELVAPIAKATQALEGGGTAEFFYADFTRPRGAEPDHIRIFWSFSGDGHWLASDLPKVTFGQYASLYKFYVLRKLPRLGEPIENDPCLDFAKLALPRLTETFFPPS